MCVAMELKFTLPRLGAAITVDGNPWWVAADPYWGTAHVVAEALRNLVAVGSEPVALTDCLNFGNPEDPEVFADFVRSVRGLGDVGKGPGRRTVLLIKHKSVGLS